MSIDRFYTTSIAVKRMTWSNESSAQVSQGSISGHFQQARPEFVEQIGEVLGRVFIVWCDRAADVEIGDSLTIASGDYAGTYSVKNAELNSFGRQNNQHKELILIRDE